MSDTSSWPLYLQIALLVLMGVLQWVAPKVLERHRTRAEHEKECAEAEKLEAEARLVQAQQNKTVADTVQGLLGPAREEMERLRQQMERQEAELRCLREMVVARDARIGELEQTVAELQDGVDRLVAQVEDLKVEPVYRRKKTNNGRTK